MDQRMRSQELAKEFKEKMVGKRYRHFKGNIYIVVEVAIHSETAEPMVIYKSGNDQSLVWTRPLDMFLSEVDREKYPDVQQKMRFEEIVD